MNRAAPIGAEVGLFVDLIARVAEGDVIETKRGRRYGVTKVRVQERGKNVGRQHLRAVVLDEGARWAGRTHRIKWYRRGQASGGSKGMARR